MSVVALPFATDVDGAERASRRSGSSGRAVMGTILVGVVVTAALSALVRMSPADAAKIGGTGGGSALVVGLVGLGVLRRLRSASVAVQTAAVGLTAVVATAAGVAVAWVTMALNPGVLDGISVVLAATATVAVASSLVLGQHVGEARLNLARVAQRIGDGERLIDEAASYRGPREMWELASELKTMSRRLDESRAAERALDESRRELIAWVSHDLRTPLAAIRAVAEALEDRVVSDPLTVARYHTTLRLEVERLSGLVDDLFELSKIQAGALRLEMSRTNLGDVVSDAIASARPVAAAKGVRLEGRLASHDPQLELSVPEVGRVLRNLLENAIRHSPSDGTVLIEAGVEEEAAFVSVADSCGGIEVDHLDRVFELAFRGDPARNGAGAGLGLAIAKGLVEAHEGAIDVVNQGPGCRFTIRLPLPVGL